MDFELLAVLLIIGFNAVTTVLPWRSRWLILVIRWLGAVTLKPLPFQSLSLSCVPSKPWLMLWRTRDGRPKEGLDGPGTLAELRVARGYTDTPWTSLRRTLALWPCLFACEIVQRLSVKLLPKALHVEAQRGTFACSLQAWCTQISQEGPSSPWSLCRHH